MKPKINYVELTGNLTKPVTITSEGSFVTIATYNGEDKKATFIDVALFGDFIEKELIKGQKITIKGRLTNYQDKKTGYTKMGVVGLSYQVLQKTVKLEQSQNNKTEQKETTQEDLGWELDL